MRKLTSAIALATLAVSTAATVALAGPAQASISGTCFGYTGTFADRTTAYPTVIGAQFMDGSRNCFGISPGRHIWDTSPGHPWYVIPGNGLADGIVRAVNLVSQPSGNMAGKLVQVIVGSSGNFYCQSYLYGQGWQSSWGRCGSAGSTTTANDADLQSYLGDAGMSQTSVVN